MEEYYQSEEFRALLSHYENIVKCGKPAYFDQNELGDIIQYYALSGMEEQAMKATELTLKLYPGAVEPLAFKARYALTIEGDVAKAEYFADLVEDKTDWEYYYLVAEILIHKDQLERMDSFLRNCFNDLDKADQDDFALDVAEMLNDYRLTELTLSWLNLVKDKQNPDYKSIKGQVLVNLGSRDYDGEGEKLLEQLTNEDPYNVTHWLTLAQAQLVKEKYSESIESCDYAIAIDPHNTTAVYIKAQALLAMEHYEEALQLFMRFHASCGESHAAISAVAIAICLVSIGESKDAIRWLNKAMKTVEDKDAFFATIYYAVSDSFPAKQVYPLMKWFFLALGEENKLFWSHMALMSLEAGQQDDYQYFLGQAIQRNPDEARVMLGGLFPRGSKMKDWQSLIPKQPIHG